MAFRVLPPISNTAQMSVPAYNADSIQSVVVNPMYQALDRSMLKVNNNLWNIENQSIISRANTTPVVFNNSTIMTFPTSIESSAFVTYSAGVFTITQAGVFLVTLGYSIDPTNIGTASLNVLLNGDIMIYQIDPFLTTPTSQSVVWMRAFVVGDQISFIANGALLSTTPSASFANNSVQISLIV